MKTLRCSQASLLNITSLDLSKHHSPWFLQSHSICIVQTSLANALLESIAGVCEDQIQTTLVSLLPVHASSTTHWIECLSTQLNHLLLSHANPFSRKARVSTFSQDVSQLWWLINKSGLWVRQCLGLLRRWGLYLIFIGQSLQINADEFWSWGLKPPKLTSLTHQSFKSSSCSSTETQHLTCVSSYGINKVVLDYIKGNIMTNVAKFQAALERKVSPWIPRAKYNWIAGHTRYHGLQAAFPGPSFIFCQSASTFSLS